MMLIDTKFELGDLVYLQTDPDQQKRLVTGLEIRPNGIIYLLSCGAVESSHYDIEISKEINVLLTSTN